METEHHKLALMFEWGGGCLWCRNEMARTAFGVGPVEEAVGLDSATLEKLHQLTEWHDTALNWEYPPDHGPWSEQEYDDFDNAAEELRDRIQKALGGSFQVEYQKLGEFEASNGQQ